MDKPTWEVGNMLSTLMTVVTPTGENVELRIIDGQLRVTVTTNVPDEFRLVTDEYDRNKYLPDNEKIYYHHAFIRTQKS